ncbi:MAG: PD-(D/E)XK nuclease family protein [Singulisphaera sp.]
MQGLRAMLPVSFSVSEVRVAASCPRILYFDAEKSRRENLAPRAMTRIWKASDDESTACGSVFHHSVERFNLKAHKAPEVRAVLEGPADPPAIERGLRTFLNGQCIDLDALATKDIRQRQAFILAIEVYMRELAQIVAYARSRGKPAGEILDQMFGDRRRRVEVTFPVGPAGEPVHVTGILDYVFYDWRTENHRIIDYKLTPANQPTKDLFQVSLYALMHHHQHRTRPDVGVLYLHPKRMMVEQSWVEVDGRRHLVYDMLASMASWVVYDETSRAASSPRRAVALLGLQVEQGGSVRPALGPKPEGQRLSHWTDAASRPSAASVRSRPSAPSDPRGPAPILGPIVLPAYGGDSLRIGTTVDGGLPVELPLAALPTHVAVVGAAGSGKTYMAKVVVEEAIRQGVPVLAIDPQGDLVQFLRAADEPPGLDEEARALRRAFLDRVETRVWTPGSSHGRRLSLTRSA